MAKNVTIDTLARMIQKGFVGVDEKFEAVDKRFDAVDKRFDEMDKRFDKIEYILITDHQKRIEKLEEKVEVLRNLVSVK